MNCETRSRINCLPLLLSNHKAALPRSQSVVLWTGEWTLNSGSLWLRCLMWVMMWINGYWCLSQNRVLSQTSLLALRGNKSEDETKSEDKQTQLYFISIQQIVVRTKRDYSTDMWSYSFSHSDTSLHEGFFFLSSHPVWNTAIKVQFFFFILKRQSERRTNIKNFYNLDA